MTLIVTIAGQDRTRYIQWNTLKIKNVLTNKADTCSFSITRTDTKTWRPVAGNEIIITADGSKVFAGVITSVEEQPISLKILRYKVNCTDYSRILDSSLVARTYENQTVDYIISDLVTTYFDPGIFTTNNVSCPVVVNYIQFKYVPGSECLKRLAELVGYDWYVDYDKDIHFFIPQTASAPIDLEDDNGSHDFESLVLRDDNTQVRNSIVVRGGTYLGDVFTSVIPVETDRFIYELPYKYTDFRCTVTGQPKSIGIDYLDSPDEYDLLYNFNEKIIRFKEGDQPIDTADTIRVSGKPNLPVIVKYKNQTLIDTFSSTEGLGDGEYEYLIIDNSINSKEGARQRARAEIETYGQTLVEGEFSTTVNGFTSGQKVRINSTIRGIDTYYIVSQVETVGLTPTTLKYNIRLISTKSFGFIELLRRLLLQETSKIEIRQNEVTDLVESADETMTLSETFTASLEHNPQSETITIGDTFTGQSPDYDVEFVLGVYNYSGTGTKRVFILNHSPLNPVN